MDSGIDFSIIFCAHWSRKIEKNICCDIFIVGEDLGKFFFDTYYLDHFRYLFGKYSFSRGNGARSFVKERLVALKKRKSRERVHAFDVKYIYCFEDFQGRLAENRRKSNFNRGTSTCGQDRQSVEFSYTRSIDPRLWNSQIKLICRMIHPMNNSLRYKIIFVSKFFFEILFVR